MNLIKFFTVCYFICSVFTTLGQKKIIDHTAYPSWKRIGEIQLSADGKYTAYTIRPMQGDGYLFIVNNETGNKDSIARGVDAQFAGKSNFIVFRIQAGYDTLRKVELTKIPKEKWPKDSLGIYFFEKDSLVKFPKVKEFKLATESDLLVYSSHTNEWPTNYLSKKEKRKEKKFITKKGPWKSDGKLTTIWQPGAKKVCFKNITGFEIAKNGQGVVLLEHQKLKKDSIRLIVFEPGKPEWKSSRRYTEISGVNFSEKELKITGLYSTDTSDYKRWNLWLWEQGNFTKLIDTAQVFETNRVLSSQYKPRFHVADAAILFGSWDKLQKPAKDTLLESEKYKLDIWHWQDKRLQPQQLVELKRDLAQVNQYSYNLSTGAKTQLGRDTLSFQINPSSTEKYVLASCDEAYQFETWKSPHPSNYYRLSLATGELIGLRNNTFFDPSLSPSGKYFVFWDEEKNAYFLKDIEKNTSNCLTCGVISNFLMDGNGTPEIPSTLGIIGWTVGEKGVILQAEKDIIIVDVANFQANTLLANIQQKNDTNYRYTLMNLEKDSVYLTATNCVLTQIHKQTKFCHVYRLTGELFSPEAQLIDGENMAYVGFKKAPKANQLVFQKQSNYDYPDLYIAKNGHEKPIKISATNPQQGLYNWSTVEQINWTSYKGIPLEGLIYKPENYDSTKSYPLLVYYYELHSDDIHAHYAPRPTASVIHPTEYASAGYFVFIPDIRYQIGHPAKGAYDCIMSGTDAVVKKYPAINEQKMGLQGQSWGGYQTAQLITMTNRYAAAMAGAPVGNMISAYGGIRWGTGISRQFQYEHTQSRIGKTIWEAPDLYIENSPVFHLTTVKTPLLIMHNDQDGAVPWYQGIEIYTGLRRLQKPVWLLNYNGDDHNLMKIPNRIDLSIRMRQFFDYYLLDKPAPIWLSEGIPALDKGKKTGY